MDQAFCNGGFVVNKHMTKHMSNAMRWQKEMEVQ